MRKTTGLRFKSEGRSADLVERFSVTLRGLKYLQAQEMLKRCGGNRKKAAQVLGIFRRIIYTFLRTAGSRSGAPGTTLELTQ
jgi:DNA-binding NtrC family response regulator